MSPFTVPDETDGDIPVGDHNVEIIAARDAGFSSNGNPQIVVDLQDINGRVLSHWITITPKTIPWRVKPFWEAAGLVWPDVGAQADEQDLVGRHVHVTVSEREWQGQMRREVSEVAPPVQSDIPFDDPVPQAAPAPGRAIFGDEDIPF